MNEFVHLHLHTEYSLLDGVCKIYNLQNQPDILFEVAQKYKMPALAITDHGNMFGAIEFYEACMSCGIKPIIGCEVYIDPEEQIQDQRKSYHLTLLVKDEIGYRNLMKLLSKGYVENLIASKGKIKKSWLAEYKDGLIALSGCLEGEISYNILENKSEETLKDIVGFYLDIFGKENFYLELMYNKIPEQKIVLEKSYELAKKMNIKTVVTNDVHYVKKEDAKLQEILLCISTRTTLDDPDRLRFSSDEFYFKSPQEMYAVFKDFPEALKNTLEIAEKCNLIIDFSKIYLPEIELPAGETADSLLRKLCYEGIKKRYSHISIEVTKRLEYELEIIKQMGFSSYFLIVYDFINYARQQKIPIGPGRGSGAGSLVSYCLGITDIDPIKYGLLFERFLNPSRKTLPDLDIDFADYGRDKVIEYVKQKYKEKNVVQIITFNTLKIKNAVRDVARVMGLPVSLADKISKLIPSADMDVDEAIRSSSELKELYKNDENVKKILDFTRDLVGRVRHTGIHAAGVIISKGDITDHTPLYRRSKDDAITTQYYDEILLKLGLLKIDFLSLKTLTVIEETLNLIKQNYNIEVNIEDIPLDDKKTFKLLQEGKTTGVFQLESTGMQDLLRKLKPTTFEDIIACIALFRPGPIRSGMVNEFVERKHKRKEIKYEHPLLEDILKETYGVLVYQEQVMKIGQVIGGFTPEEADELRAAVAKKVPEKIEKMESKFLDGAKKNGIELSIAKKIYQQILNFGGYGFNKSHATAYAVTSYKCAYLKANYPVEYLIALINAELRSGANVKTKDEKNYKRFLLEVENMKYELLPPDINESDVYFKKETEKAIRYGLVGIKNVGENAAEFIVNVRKKTGKFKSFEDFLERAKEVNKRAIESLILSGSMDSLAGKGELSLEEKCFVRKKYINFLENKKEIKKEPQFLFSALNDKNYEKEKIEKFTEHEILAYEHMLTEVYWSGHPLEKYIDEIKNIISFSIETLPEEENYEVEIVGMITSVKKHTTQSGQSWAKIMLEDLTGEIEVSVFNKLYEEKKHLLHKNCIIYLKGKIALREEKKFIVADDIELFEIIKEKIYKNKNKIYISISDIGVDDEYINNLKKLIEKHPGNTQVYFKIITKNLEEFIIETEYKILPSKKFLSELESFLGEKSYFFE